MYILYLSWTEFNENGEDYPTGNEIDTDAETSVDKHVEHVDADKKNENTHEEISGSTAANVEVDAKAVECGTDHGCDHDCYVENNSIRCSCHPGFYLDESDSRTCNGEWDTQSRLFSSFRFIRWISQASRQQHESDFIRLHDGEWFAIAAGISG